jgi:Lecithin:cholesterol acyltransferase.
LDEIDDSFYHPLHSDPSCRSEKGDESCWNPPQNTVETEQITIDATALYGGNDPSEGQDRTGERGQQQQHQQQQEPTATAVVDKHWGRDETILKMRDKLRNMGRGKGTESNPHENKRPPIFLMPGLASTRLVSWKYKVCSNPLLSDVKVQDYVWMNINMLLQMATLDDSCFLECMTLGLNQTDTNDIESGCKLRPDEGLDAISSLAPDSIGTNVLVGGKNTVYAWLTQWLADNLGYDVSSIVGLPYDWRLSPDVMEARDGFLTLTRKRIEAAVATNGEPGIMVAHSVRIVL